MSCKDDNLRYLHQFYHDTKTPIISFGDQVSDPANSIVACSQHFKRHEGNFVVMDMIIILIVVMALQVYIYMSKLIKLNTSYRYIGTFHCKSIIPQ